MSLWLIARSNGDDARIVSEEGREQAVRSRIDVLGDGVWCVWRLGNFPHQFEIRGKMARALGNQVIAGDE